MADNVVVTRARSGEGEVDRMEGKNRCRKRMAIRAVAVATITAVALMGHTAVCGGAEPETPSERITVERDGIPVYSHMATTAIVVMQLMRGDVVRVEPADSTSEGAWCRVREVAVWGRSGYVRCEDLKGTGSRAAPSPKTAAPPKAAAPSDRPREAPRSVERPAPLPTTKGTEPEGETGKRYTVQVAALIVEQNALSLKDRLEKLGYAPFTYTTTAPITRHHVYGGQFTNRAEAERVARQLNVDGFPSNMVEGEDGQFRLEVGSFLKVNEAIDLARRLQQKNYASKIVSKAVPTPVHAVRIGAYETRAEALQTVEALKKEGYAPVIVGQ